MIFKCLKATYKYFQTMKFLLTLTLFATILGTISCEKKVTKTYFDEQTCSEELEIIIDEVRVLINKETESGTYERFKKSEPIVIETKNFTLTKSEIDRLFKHSFELIKSNNYRMVILSCFAGQDFKIRLNCSNKTLEFHENSVEKWSKISNHTTEIRNILNTKITIVE